MRTLYPVQICGKKYSEEFQSTSKYALPWKKVLSRAYQHEAVVCQCPGKGDKRLAIKHISATDSYHLARFSDSGDQHHFDCKYYQENERQSGQQAYQEGVIQHQSGSDMVKIRLARGMRAIDPGRPHPDPAPPRQHQAPGRTQGAMTLLGLLHYLWTEARINQWSPKFQGKRTHRVVARELINAASRIKANGLLLETALLTLASKGMAEVQRNEAIARACASNGTRPIIVAPLAKQAVDDPTPKHWFRLGYPLGTPFLTAEDKLIARTEQRFARELSAWRNHQTIIAIIHCEMNPLSEHRKPTAKAADIALMQVSEMWIPVDSGHELQLENVLRKEGRAFSKPLRFDAEEDVVFPDFWLLDTESPLPMEVFGMNTEAYLQRKAEKERHYRTQYGTHWWQWNAEQNPRSIPPLPPIQR